MNHKILIRTENIDWSDHKSNLVPKLLSVPPKLQILPPHATLARSKEIFSLMYLQFTQVGFFLKFQFDSFPSSVTSLPPWKRESIVLPPSLSHPCPGRIAQSFTFSRIFDIQNFVTTFNLGVSITLLNYFSQKDLKYQIPESWFEMKGESVVDVILARFMTRRGNIGEPANFWRLSFWAWST